MPLLKLPNVSVPIGGDVYSISLNQGYSEAPSTIDVSVVNGGPASPSLGGSPVSISIGDLSFKGYCYSAQYEEKVGEKVAHLKYCDGSIILDQIQVGLIQRHYGVPKEEAALKPITGTFQCPQCDGSTQKVKAVAEVRVRTGNFEIGDVFIMGSEEATHSQCDFPDVNYTFGDLIGLMGRRMSIRFLPGAGPGGSYRNKFVGSLREVLSNWCAEYALSFYWDFVSNSLVIYSLAQGIQIGEIFNTIKNSTAVYVKSIKQGQDLSSSHSHGVATMKQMPSQTFSSVPYRNFVGIYYTTRNFTCGGHLHGGMIAKMFGSEARKAYFMTKRAWAKVGYSNLAYVKLSIDKSPEASRLNNPCHPQTGIPTICENIMRTGGWVWLGTYDENLAAQQEELDLCEANNYASVAEGPYFQPGGVIWGDPNAALNGQQSEGVCEKSAGGFKRDSISNQVTPSPQIIEAGNKTMRGISLNSQYGIGSWSGGGEGFAYKIEGQSARWFSYKGATIFVFPSAYLNFNPRIDTKIGTGDGKIGDIISDVDNGGQTPVIDCGCAGADTSKICTPLSNCDPTRWVRRVGWFAGSQYIQIDGVRGPTTGNYVGFIEQTRTTASSVEPVERYALEGPPSSRSVMNTSLTLVDANGDNSTELPNVPPAYADNAGRIEKSLEIVGVLDRSLQGQLTPANGVESFQINFGSEGITTIINFANKGRKFPNPNAILGPTISARGNYRIPSLGIGSQ